MVKEVFCIYNMDDGTHYLLKLQNKRRIIMKSKKIFKKLLAAAFALVITLSSTGAAVKEAEAAICPPHGEYYDTVRDGRTQGYQHKVQKRIYAYDTDGNLIDITEGLVKKYYEICSVSFDQLYVIVRCKKCNFQIGSYTYTTPKIHSICPVG